MTLEERIAALEREVTELKQVVLHIRPIGPSPIVKDRDRDQMIEQILEVAKEKKDVPPVDRSCRTLIDGSPVTEDHREINPKTGMQKGYVVLCAEERAKGFVKPVRRTYVHDLCAGQTTMGLALAETYARDPGFYTGTFCSYCQKNFTFGQPDGDFHWLDGEKIGETKGLTNG